jgi:hypothetical protein
MVHLYGCPVAPEDAAWLVAELYRDAHAPGVSAALMIEKGIERELYAVALTPDERTAILGCLVDAPDSLAEFRGRLATDHAHRTGLR